MENLAGKADYCDEVIRRELHRCRICSVPYQGRPQSDVPYTVRGQLGPFEFHRFWRYWSVQGQFPIKMAVELYCDPCGREQVRAAGDCGCRNPRDVAEWYLPEPDGRRILYAEEQQLCERLIRDDEGFRQRFEEKFPRGAYWAENPSEVPGAVGFVTLYHIDSELGLRIFADALRTHGLV